MKTVDISMTPYCFFRLPFEEQLKQANMSILNNFDFFKHSMFNRRELLLAADPLWAVLEEKLLVTGGSSVCYSAEPHLEELVNRGVKFAGKSMSIKGNTSHCHGNVSTMWRQCEKDMDFKIATGWALTKDGMWRQHSWGRVDGKVTVETTVKRTKYFGFVLTNEEAEKFAIENPY